MGQLNKRVPLVGKVPPWRQPPKAADPDAPRPFAWLAADEGGNDELRTEAGPNRSEDADSGHEWRQMSAPGTLRSLYAASAAVSPNAGPLNVPRQVWPGMKSQAIVSQTLSDGLGTRSNVPPADAWHESTADVSIEGPGPSASGMWEQAPESPPAIRPGGSSDDEGGPGDSPASVAWLRAGRGTGYGVATPDRVGAPGLVDGRAIDPESRPVSPPTRPTDRPRGREPGAGP